nr:SirN [Plenodomus lingam]
MTVETKDLPESNYLLDYDDTEKRRLREQHDLIKAYTGKLILAPLDLTKPNLKILDSGTFDELPADSPFKASELEEIFVDWDKEIETIGSLLRFAVVWGRRPALD